jgi:hypothetical protein
MPSRVTPVAPDALSSMPTRALLALRNRMLACEESLAASDATPDELDPDVIRFKDDPRWKPSYDAVKAVLATREHVPRRSR